MLIQYFFYKNVAAFTAQVSNFDFNLIKPYSTSDLQISVWLKPHGCLLQVYFACINQFSTETLYDSLCLANFNMVYTALPVFLLGLFEQVGNCGTNTDLRGL